MIGVYESTKNNVEVDVTMEYVKQEWQDCYMGCPEYAEYQEEWN